MPSYFAHQWSAEVFCVGLFVMGHSVGLAPVTWLTIAEIFTPQSKWIGITISSLLMWIAMLAVDVAFRELRSTIMLGGVFWFHCVCCVAGYIFVLVFFRELKHQNIEHVSDNFTVKKEKKSKDIFLKV